MNNETFTMILAFIGAVIAAVLFVLDRTNRRLGDSLPPALLPILPVLINALVLLASQTETTLDDEIVRQLKDALGMQAAKPVGTELTTIQTVTTQTIDTPKFYVPEDEAAS
jgi:hypothetical protein